MQSKTKESVSAAENMEQESYSVQSFTEGDICDQIGTVNGPNYLTSAPISQDCTRSLDSGREAETETLLRIVRVIGEKWMLSILLSLQAGNFRFSELERNLGISSSMLHGRLKQLLDLQVIEASKKGVSGRTQLYRLTLKGTELLETVRLLDGWCRKHASSQEALKTGCIKDLGAYLTGPMIDGLSSMSDSTTLYY